MTAARARGAIAAAGLLVLATAGHAAAQRDPEIRWTVETGG